MHKQNLFYKSIEQLVKQAQNNNYKALEELIKRIQKKVYTTLLYLNKSEENIADLTQEVLIKIVKSLPSLKNTKAFNTWVNQIILNVFYDSKRQENKKPKTYSFENILHYHEIPDTLGLPIKKAIYSETDKKIRKEIYNLPDNFRIVIILRELQGLSYEEIANVTKTNINTVKSRIARAREKLQLSLKNYI